MSARDAQADVSVQDTAIFRSDGENASVVVCILQVKENAAVCLVRGGGAGVRVPNLLGCSGNGYQSKYEGNGKMFHSSGCYSSNINAGSPSLKSMNKCLFPRRKERVAESKVTVPSFVDESSQAVIVVVHSVDAD